MRLPRLLLAAALLAALGSGAVGLATGSWMLSSDVPGFGGEEANVVYTVQQLVAGQPIYADPSEPPFAITQYAPLYYVASAAVAQLCGIQATDPGGITWACRLVSLMAGLGVCLLVFGLAVRLRLPVAVGVLAAAFCFVAAVPWHFLARPDGLACFFLLLAVYLAMGVDQARPWRSHLFAAVAVLAGFLAVATKQNGVQALGLVLLYLLLARAWKQSATALLTGAAVVGLTVALAGPIRSWLGPALKENLIDGVRNGLDPLAALDRTFGPYFRQYAFLVALAGLASVALMRKGNSPRRRFLALAPALLLLFACGTGLKAGSSINYFVEFTIFAALASACWLSGVLPGEAASPLADQPPTANRQPLTRLALVAVAFFLPFVALDQYQRCCYVKSLPRTLRPDPRHQFAASEGVARLLRDELRDNPDALVLPVKAPWLGNQLFPHVAVPQPTIAEYSHSLGVVDYRRFRACVAEGKVAYVVTRGGPPPARFLGAGFENFRLLREADGYAIYECGPRPTAGR